MASRKGGGGTLYLFGKWPIVAYFYGQIGLFPSEKPGNPDRDLLDLFL